MSTPALPVLSVASECVPFVKTGGLADVVGALPAALAPHGIALRTLLPGYPAVMAALGTRGVAEQAAWDDLFGGPARLLAGRAAGLDLLVLDAPHLFARMGSPYLGPDGKDWPDNDLRFAALSLTAARIGAGRAGAWQPQVLHLHDWQAGLAPVYLRERDGQMACGTLLTIHNIAFQGLTPASRMGALGLPAWVWHPGGAEYWGQISALKAGLVYSDRISTVSPTYARELLTPEFGTGLDGVLRERAASLSGILNGIDLDAWTPPFKTLRGKAAHTRSLRAELGLPDATGPLCVVISRLTQQKGLDLLLEVLPALLGRGGQLAVLGAGEAALEEGFQEAARQHEGISVTIGYDEPLAHRMIAGGEAILVPSRFEPCGLTQLYGLHFGTVPLVALTGGLADTVIDANAAALRAGVATGVQFHPATAAALEGGLHRLCDLHAQGAPFAAMQRAGMRGRVDWDASAAEYANLYRAIIAERAT
jgi:starch synthase